MREFPCKQDENHLTTGDALLPHKSCNQPPIKSYQLQEDVCRHSWALEMDGRWLTRSSSALCIAKLAHKELFCIHPLQSFHILMPPELITSATEGEGGCFYPSLSVCLCAGYLKKLWMDPDEIWWASGACDKDELLTF